MKYLTIGLLLFPSLVFAGGSHHYTPPSVVPPVVPPVVVVPPPPASVVIPPSTPTVVQFAPPGGGTQVYCSSPTAPGYQVGVPDGGCKPMQNTPNLRKPTYILLNVIPPTGPTFTDFLYDLFFWWM